MKTSEEIRELFPLVRDSGLAYLDSGATSQKPESVIKAMDLFYEKSNANIHRGAYDLSYGATVQYDGAREKVASFIHAVRPEEVVFSKNATESINLLAYTLGMETVSEGDEIVITVMEHHSNLVPWQRVARAKKAKLVYLYIDGSYTIPDSELTKITPRTKIVSVTAVSNVLGTVVDTKKIADRAHSVGAAVILDISQCVSHMPFDARTSGADFAVFSGHKMYGSLGCGVLWGKYDLLDSLSPFLTGGDMIEYVTEQDTTYAPVPQKFEAGTQDVAAAVSLGCAVDFINSVGFGNIRMLEENLTDYAMEKLGEREYVTVYAPEKKYRSPVISFNITGVHPHDTATVLNSYGVCVRSGNHCAQPLMRYLDIDSTCRATICMYNTKEDIDRLISAIDATYARFEKYLGR